MTDTITLSSVNLGEPVVYMATYKLGALRGDLGIYATPTLAQQHALARQTAKDWDEWVEIKTDHLWRCRGSKGACLEVAAVRVIQTAPEGENK